MEKTSKHEAVDQQRFDDRLKMAMMEADRLSDHLNELAKGEANKRLSEKILNRGVDDAPPGSTPSR